MFLYILEKVTKNESKNKVDTFFFLLYLSVFRQGKIGVHKKKKVERQIYFLKYNRKSSIVFVRITVQLSVTEIKRAYFTLYRFDCLRNLTKKKKRQRVELQ